MEKIWLKHYPPGIASTINEHEFASLGDVLRLSCERFAELPAYSNMGASLSYAELNQTSRDFAAYLQGPLGLRRGERVAIMMPNLLQYPVALFGVLRAGLVVVKYVKKMVSPWEIEGVIEFHATLRMGRELTLHHVPLSHTDIAFLQYTGGTTGVAKGAVLTHGNLVANLQQVGAWIAQDLPDGKETLICPLPLYHIFALACSLVFMKIVAALPHSAVTH